VKDLNGFSDLVESNACFMLASWRATLCNSSLPKNLSHEPMVQLEISINKNDYFTSNKQTLNNRYELNLVQSTMCMDS
jgi:hypothetical protein